MKVPVTVKLLGLTVGATLFYTWVGQLVPQKEVLPPEVVEMSEDLSTDDLVEIGQTIYEGKGICVTCHTIGSSGALRFPDLDGIAVRAANQIPGMGALEYLAQSLYEPDAYIVEGFNPGMPQIDKPPIGLSDDEIKAVIAYLQTLGGEATITMATVVPYSEGAEATSDVDPPGPGDEPPAGEAVAGAVAPTATAVEGAATVPAGAGAAAGAAGPVALGRFGCGQCHTGAPGEAAALPGRALTESQALVAIVDHRPPLSGPAAGMTLVEARALARELAAGGGSDGGGR